VSPDPSGAQSALIQTCLRVSFLLNGAAIVAVLSLYGAKVNAFSNSKAALGIALLLWALGGLVATTVATSLYTCAQRYYQVAAREKAEKWAKNFRLDSQETSATKMGDCLRLIAIVFWWISISAFCIGAGVLISCTLFT
jgi:hypothetical protein